MMGGGGALGISPIFWAQLSSVFFAITFVNAGQAVRMCSGNHNWDSKGERSRMLPT